ncbi:MAG: hypothetical protein K8U03_27105 [Planctomycetia bacterium]|nr:hypothetical protein [Planctomycetia bacterium]
MLSDRGNHGGTAATAAAPRCVEHSLRRWWFLAFACVLSFPGVALRGDEPTTKVVAAAVDAELSPIELAEAAANEEAAAFSGSPQTIGYDEAASLSAPSIAGTEAVLASDTVAPADELWFVSARRARCVDGEAVGLDYWKYDSAGRWRTATLEEFTAADSKVPTCFHVHGNRVSVCEANFGGWKYYSTFTGGCRERGPLRWVIFSWPSDRLDCGPRKDVQIKAVRAECYGFYLAWLVDRLSPEAHVSMIGYSFGTRLIGSSLHYLGGGKLRGRQLAEIQVEDRGVRTVLLAAALDNNHFSPGHAMQAAPSQIDHLLLGCNQQDPALKWYALLYQLTFRPRRGQQALGHSGVAGLQCMPELKDRVEQRDLSCAVGREHDTHGFHYLTPWFTERMRTYVYFEDVDGTN